MPRPKGPEKVAVKLLLTRPTFEWLERKAGDKRPPTYLAEQIERQAASGIKNERQVQPIPKGGKK
jgi:hypothetical protein